MQRFGHDSVRALGGRELGEASTIPLEKAADRVKRDCPCSVLKMSEFLDVSELLRLTGYARVAEQAQWLVAHSIPHHKDGRRIIVSRMHVRLWLEGRLVQNHGQPNWAALNVPLGGAHA